MKSMTEGIRKHKQKMMEVNSDSPIYTCDDREPDGTKADSGAFLPVFVGEVNTEFPTATYAGRCFDSINFDPLKSSGKSFDITVHLSGKKSKVCHENIIFANTEFFHIETFMFEGPHILHFNMQTAEE